MDHRWEIVLVSPQYTDRLTWDAHVRATQHVDFNNRKLWEACLDPIYQAMRQWCVSVFGEPSVAIPKSSTLRWVDVDPPEDWRWVDQRWLFRFRHKRDLAMFKLRWYQQTSDAKKQLLTRM